MFRSSFLRAKSALNSFRCITSKPKLSNLKQQQLSPKRHAPNQNQPYHPFSVSSSSLITTSKFNTTHGPLSIIDGLHRDSRKGRHGDMEFSRNYLGDLNWEVFVVRTDLDTPDYARGLATAFGGLGKVYITTSMLDWLESDAEIAGVLSHEVGHCVARHVAEKVNKKLWFNMFQLIVLPFVRKPKHAKYTTDVLLKLPFRRRNEMEAEYIGMLLMASAGYDPRVMITMRKKVAKKNIQDIEKPWAEHLSTHPYAHSFERFMTQAHIIGEALAIYNETFISKGKEQEMNSETVGINGSDTHDGLTRPAH